MKRRKNKPNPLKHIGEKAQNTFNLKKWPKLPAGLKIHSLYTLYRIKATLSISWIWQQAEFVGETTFLGIWGVWSNIHYHHFLCHSNSDKLQLRDTWDSEKSLYIYIYIRRILEGVRAKKPKWEQYHLSTLLRPLTPFTEERWSKFYSPTAYHKKQTSYIYIIMSCYLQNYPWPWLATTPYRLFLPAGLQDYISYQNRADGWNFELVVQPLLVNIKVSTGEHHFWAHPYFSRNVPHVWLV